MFSWQCYLLRSWTATTWANPSVLRICAGCAARISVRLGFELNLQLTRLIQVSSSMDSRGRTWESEGWWGRARWLGGITRSCCYLLVFWQCASKCSVFMRSISRQNFLYQVLCALEAELRGAWVANHGWVALAKVHTTRFTITLQRSKPWLVHCGR